MSSVLPRSVALKPYAPVASAAVRGLSVQVQEAGAGCLHLRYELEGDLARLRIPPPRPPSRADELWKHTCFEAFVRGAGTAYHELNVSPATEWALYSFTDYRKGMSSVALAQPSALDIQVERGAGRLQLAVKLRLPELPPAGRLALSAVLELEDGSVSYWALAHCAARPDFHHADSFLLEF